MNARLLRNTLLRGLFPHPRWAVISVPYLWLLVFFAIPFLIVLKISFSKLAIAMPPYTPIMEYVDNAVSLKLNLTNYIGLFTDSLYVQAYLSSIKIAAISTLLALLIGYPMAYVIAKLPPSARNIAMMLVVLPLYTNLVKHDHRLLEAAYDLGAKPWQAFLKITLPLSKAGIIAGCMLVMIPAVGEFVIPELLGGPDTLMIGRVLWGEFFNNRDWPAASAVAIVMLILLLIPILIFNRVQQRELEGRLT